MSRVENSQDVEKRIQFNGLSGKNGFVNHGLHKEVLADERSRSSSDRDDKRTRDRGDDVRPHSAQRNNDKQYHDKSNNDRWNSEKGPQHRWPVDEEGQRMPKGEAEIEKEEEEDPGTFVDAVVEICENTSFQGVPYIVAPTPFTLRRSVPRKMRADLLFPRR